MKSSDLRKAVIIIGHGSRENGFQEAMEKVAEAVRNDGSFGEVVCAYLEITEPSIEQAIEQCVNKNISEIRLLPYFLLTGRHVNSHIPEIVSAAREKYKKSAKIILCPYLGYDEKIVSLTKKRIGEGK